MAIKKIEMKELVSQNPDTYDTLVPNCIVNNDTGATYGFTVDGGILKASGGTISTSKILWEGFRQSGDTYDSSITITLDEKISSGDIIEIEYAFGNTGNPTRNFVKVRVVGDDSNNQIPVSVVYSEPKLYGGSYTYIDTTIVSSNLILKTGSQPQLVVPPSYWAFIEVNFLSKQNVTSIPHTAFYKTNVYSIRKIIE